MIGSASMRNVSVAVVKCVIVNLATLLARNGFTVGIRVSDYAQKLVLNCAAFATKTP